MLSEGVIISGLVGGVISKIINDGADYSKATIKSVLKDRNNRNFSTKIYRIIEKALIEVTNKKYNNDDILYDAIEHIFCKFRDNDDTLDAVKCGLSFLSSDVSIEKCETFLGKFYEGIRKDDDLYKTVNMILQQKGIKISKEEFKKLNEKIDDLTEIVSSINVEYKEKIEKIADEIDIFDIKKKFIELWERPLFLHRGDVDTIRLSDIYIVPTYTMSWGKYNLEKKFEEIVKDKNQRIIILGQPGSGKSSLSYFLANKYKNNDQVLFLSFPQLKKEIVSSGESFCKFIKENFNISSQITIVLDAYDENIFIENKTKFLAEIMDIMSDEKINIVVMCRLNYINFSDIRYEKYFNSVTNIILNNFDDDQMIEFDQKYKKRKNVSINTEDVLKDKEILGIPIILYMVYSLELKIDEINSRMKLYDIMFSISDGIYEKYRIKGERYSDSLRKFTLEEKGFLDLCAKNIGFAIFRNSDNVKSISRCFCDKIVDELRNEVNLQKDISKLMKEIYLTINYYNVSENVEFIHKSIYEYFVGIYFYEKIRLELENDTKDDLNIMKLFYDLFSSQNYSDEIAEVIIWELCDTFKQYNDKHLFLISELENMAINGISVINGKFRMTDEILCFRNLTSFVGAYVKTLSIEYLLFRDCIDKEELEYRIRKSSELTLKTLYSFDLSGLDLSRLDLQNVDLQYANLYNCKLENTNLSSANLYNSIVDIAELRKANINEIKIEHEKFMQIWNEIQKKKNYDYRKL